MLGLSPKYSVILHKSVSHQWGQLDGFPNFKVQQVDLLGLAKEIWRKSKIRYALVARHSLRAPHSSENLMKPQLVPVFALDDGLPRRNALDLLPLLLVESLRHLENGVIYLNVPLLESGFTLFDIEFVPILYTGQLSVASVAR